MKRIKMTTNILGVAAVAVMAIGCGKGFEPTKVPGSLNTNKTGNGPTEVQVPDRVDTPPSIEVMARTLPGVQLELLDDGSYLVKTLVRLDDLNAYEATAILKDMKDGEDVTAEMTVRDLRLAVTPVEPPALGQVMARCLEECSIVDINIRLISEESKRILGEAMVVPVSFKLDAAEYLVSFSGAGHEVGSGAQEYGKALVALESEIATEGILLDESQQVDDSNEVDLNKVSTEDSEELQEIDLSTLPKKSETEVQTQDSNVESTEEAEKAQALDEARARIANGVFQVL